MSINLGLLLLKRYRVPLTIIWQDHTIWADALYEDREGRKRFRVRKRNKKHIYPLVKDCRVLDLERTDYE
jgi:hypothetical protein